MLLITKFPLDEVQGRPGLSCNLMYGFNVIVEKLISFILVLVWSSGECLSQPPSHCAFRTVTDSFKWCLQIPLGLVTRKFRGWCITSFLLRLLRFLEANAFLTEGWLLTLLLLSFRWQIKGPAHNPLSCCGQVQEIGWSLTILWPWVCSIWTCEGGMLNSGIPNQCGIVKLQSPAEFIQFFFML